MDYTHRRLFILRVYFLLMAASSILASILVWRIVRLEGDDSLFGISSAWVGFIALFFVSAGLFLYLLNRVSAPSGPKHLFAHLSTILDDRRTSSIVYISACFIYAFSSIFLFSASPVIHGPTYPEWLVPFFLWLFILSLLTLIHFAAFQDRGSHSHMLRLVLLILIITGGVLVNLQFWSYGSPRKEDIFFTFLDGGRLLDGLNPYERILSGDMGVNNKYSTYLPIFYYLSAGSQALGLSGFWMWLSIWRIIFLVVNLSIAGLLFYIPARRGILILSTFASLFWLFNRWTLHVSKTGDIDFLALFLMLASLYLYQRHAKASFLLLGLSLGIKQMAIFLIPLYLIWVWNDSSRTDRIKNIILAIVFIGIIPMLTSMPFVLWNWEGFFKSILFSATREAVVVSDVYSLDTVLGLRGIPAKIPMLIMLGIVYLLGWKHEIGRYTPAMLAMAVFVFFNSVMFTSYMVWVVALIPLAVYEYIVTKGLTRLEA